MSTLLNSRKMCELILASSDATAAEKQVAQVRLDELDAGDESRVYIRLDSVDDAPDRASIVAAIRVLDPNFSDSPSLTLSYLQGRLDQMQSSHAVKGTSVTGSAAQPVARSDAHDEHEGFMHGLHRTNTLARYEQQRQSAISYCRGDAAAEKAAVARLDASIAHEAELAEYRADRSQETKLDADSDNLSPVVRAQVQYHATVRNLHRAPSSGGFNGSGNSAA